MLAKTTTEEGAAVAAITPTPTTANKDSIVDKPKEETVKAEPFSASSYMTREQDNKNFNNPFIVGAAVWQTTITYWLNAYGEFLKNAPKMTEDWYDVFWKPWLNWTPQPNGTVNRDLSYLRQQAKSNIRRYIDERLPEEYEKCLVGLTAILREAWNTSQQAEDRREKIQSLSLAKECYSMKLDLITNATVVDDAIRFVASGKSKDKDREQVKSPASTSSDSSNEDNSNISGCRLMMLQQFK